MAGAVEHTQPRRAGGVHRVGYVASLSLPPGFVRSEVLEDFAEHLPQKPNGGIQGVKHLLPA